MDQILGVDYLPVLERVERDKQNLRDLELEVYGFTHETLGQRLMQSWNLPDEFSQAVGLAEQPQLAGGEIGRLAKTLYICNIACQNRTLGYIENPQASRKLYTACQNELNLNELALKVLMDETKQEIQKMQEEGWFN
jgi:HD-like signal output (HDOD) protein